MDLIPFYTPPCNALFITDAIAIVKKIIVLYIKADVLSSDSSEKNFTLKNIDIAHIVAIKTFQFILYLTSYNTTVWLPAIILSKDSRA